METAFIVPVPGILVTRRDIENAKGKKETGEITERALRNWATMLLMNDAYEFEKQDEDLIAEGLNDISFVGNG